MNNPLFNQLNKDNIHSSNNQFMYNQNQTNNDNNQLKSTSSDSKLYNMQPASDLFSNSSKEPEFSISNDNTNTSQNLINFQNDYRPNVSSPLTQNVLNPQIQNSQSIPFTSTPPPNQVVNNIQQDNIFDTLAYNNINNNTSNVNNNWPDYLTNQQPQSPANNYNTNNGIPNIMDSYNNYNYNNTGNVLTTNVNNNLNPQMTNSNFPNFYSQINSNQNTFSPTVQNQMSLLQDYSQPQQNTYNQNKMPINDPLLNVNPQQQQQQSEQYNSMNYKQDFNANFADPEMFKSLPSINMNQYNNNTTINNNFNNNNNNYNSNLTNNLNNSNNNNLLQNSMNDPLNVNNISNNIVNNNLNMVFNGENQFNKNNSNSIKLENKNINNLYNKSLDNSLTIQPDLERTNSGIMNKSSSQTNDAPLSIKTSSFQTVNSIEFNSPGTNSVIAVETDKSSILTPFPEIQPSSITWEKLFSSLELPPSFINCQTPPLPESSKLSLDNWVDSDIFFIIPNSDSLIDYLKKYFPKDTIFNRGLPKAEEHDKYPEGTGILITSQSWHALAVLTKKQILTTPPTKVDTLMRLWYCHILALSKLGLIQIARAEIQKLGDFENDPKYQFESYPDLFPGLYGTFISFEIRVLKVLLLSQIDDTKQSLNGIYSLLHETKKRIIILERSLEETEINTVEEKQESENKPEEPSEEISEKPAEGSKNKESEETAETEAKEEEKKIEEEKKPEEKLEKSEETKTEVKTEEKKSEVENEEGNAPEETISKSAKNSTTKLNEKESKSNQGSKNKLNGSETNLSKKRASREVLNKYKSKSNIYGSINNLRNSKNSLNGSKTLYGSSMTLNKNQFHHEQNQEPTDRITFENTYQLKPTKK
ncbi:hypothetical protein PIROE2DRAFT_68901 [Piromyces sp. E2]|nr:hypothetical protein PIROE2DRAFT_68901 [Piromyces sp. E2]|eukprot:OUM66858.1 hypothetical protein PIROE2DRAFT_68901 [Piromyces sp. E2]